MILRATRGPDRPRSKQAHNIWFGVGSEALCVEEKTEREKGTSFQSASMEEKVEESSLWPSAQDGIQTAGVTWLGKPLNPCMTLMLKDLVLEVTCLALRAVHTMDDKLLL